MPKNHNIGLSICWPPPRVFGS